MSKLYYSITEVAEMFQVNPSLLRFWEKEFDCITPRKNVKGTRFYTEEDIQTIKQIHLLLRVQGLTIPGARMKLKDNKDIVAKNQEIYERLSFVRKEIIEIRSILNQFSDGKDDEKK